MSTKTGRIAESSEEQRRRAAVKRLPAPQPSVAITVPLALWPLYMQLYQIEPKQYKNPVLIVQKKKEVAHEKK